MKNKEFYLPIILGAIATIVLSGVALYFNIIAGLICFVLGIFMLTVFIISTKKRHEKLAELNSYLSRVINGDYDLGIADNTEGELSILKNNLLKVITSLKASNEAVTNDKIYLADSLADISHQLKTPLTSIMLMTDLLKDESDTKKQAEFIDIIENQSDKMRWLIFNLLKLSKLDAGTVEFNMAEYGIDDLIDASIKPFELSLDLKSISLNKSLEPFTINCDKNWLSEAIANIIKNCIEHTDNGGSLFITTTSTTLYNQIIIEDNGSGISEADLPHIFERFYHGENSSSDSVGIGLALAKEILKRHKASITATSTMNVGTKFDIRFYKSIV